MTQTPDRPGIDQLRNLADRAERGPLTTDEAGRLRDGIDQLGARAEKAERAVDHLTDRYRGAEAEVQQWRDTYGEHALRRTLARLYDAETTVERLRALASQWAILRAHGGAATELRAVLDQHGQTPGADS